MGWGRCVSTRSEGKPPGDVKRRLWSTNRAKHPPAEIGSLTLRLAAPVTPKPSRSRSRSAAHPDPPNGSNSCDALHAHPIPPATQPPQSICASRANVDAQTRTRTDHGRERERERETSIRIWISWASCQSIWSEDVYSRSMKCKEQHSRQLSCPHVCQNNYV